MYTTKYKPTNIVKSKGSTPETFFLRCMYLKNGDEFFFFKFEPMRSKPKYLLLRKKDAQNIVLNNINHYVLLPGL